ncbi:MAG: hypothetical protein M1817_002322 [Caeruleum heppii]|nr:MAG: hypothetical protein M1817_003493 [Caeruleum heppii]KAI9673684.1 MAG: hypothetical protein M1817_002322 [Caeruleum heppii]
MAHHQESSGKTLRTRSSTPAELADLAFDGADERSSAQALQRKYGFDIVVPAVTDPATYEDCPVDVVDEVLEHHQGVDGRSKYRIRFRSGHKLTVRSTGLLDLPNGLHALRSYRWGQQATHADKRRWLSPDSEDSSTMSASHERQARAKRARPAGMVSTMNLQLTSEEDVTSPEKPATRTRLRLRVKKKARTTKGGFGSDSDETPRGDSSSHSDSADSLNSPYTSQQIMFKYAKPRKKQSARSRQTGKASDTLPRAAEGTRRSDRTGRAAKNMMERGEDDIWASDDENTASATARAIGAKEVFARLPRDSAFRLAHSQWCDSCGIFGDNHDRGPLIFCQACTISHHKACLGPRTTRDHIVTMIAEKDSVLQCRRCIGFAQKKEATAPNQSACQVCEEESPARKAFREKRTAKQEEKERAENDGKDPIIPVDENLINNHTNVLFRCEGCRRAFHFHHLPPRTDIDEMDTIEGEDVGERRFREYCQDWRCLECISTPAKLQTLVAWRPTDLNRYVPGSTVEMVPEDDKEYLVKWEKLSYFRCSWMPGAWVWGVASPATRKAFAKQNNGYNLPHMSAEDAVPEEYLRIDIVLDVRFDSVVSIDSEEIDKARIREVDQALIKYKGLGYEEVVWENVPGPDDGDRWKDFVLAYEDWVLGRYIHLPKLHYLRERLEKARSLNFESKLLKRKQPEALVGGKLMDYQLEGLNWAYYKWYKQQNGILADEMGLGKTIQIIGLLATLVQDHKCWPFLIVVPNSTCPNWRREIKQWAPSLRVVAYYGSAEARRLAMQHELYPNGSKDLRCHIVVTSYEAPVDEHSRRFFRAVPWQGLIVDEGQRLKNDKNQLYEALGALKVPFKLLLTGTPLQNNARELFNLLQFLDRAIDASRLELDYAELTKENVPRLHEMIRPFFLRRTKAQVLTFLPPMAQVIVPVTMSIVQKKLYRSILAKNPELIKSIFGNEKRKLKQADRSNLNNLLMQLRKCLCHPFVYSRLIEERHANATVSHRNLVDASSKLQLLDIMLPKLHERGHRVLIFSQFLEMLDIVEDFLDGLGLAFQRLDGTISSLQKQKRIDMFNHPDSTLFAFLLSTRAGGVGINLATADTVVILDPDFNPHQDIQALSRAHRIGQKKKVLVFQLMTRDSAEEKIVQAGRKKMALDHVLVEQMGQEDDAGMDLESILKHGAAALFDDNDESDIRYDGASVDRLLDRSQVESTQTGNDHSAESQFSYARIWANDQLQDGFENSTTEESTPDPTVWDKILQEREQVAAQERASRQETFGRGKRRRQAIAYDPQPLQELEENLQSPTREAATHSGSSDTDFQDKAVEDEAEESADDGATEVDPDELRGLEPGTGRVGGLSSHPRPPPKTAMENNDFTRAVIPTIPPAAASGEAAAYAAFFGANNARPPSTCVACGQFHPVGSCPLKVAGVEYCPLCGVAHFAGPQCLSMQTEEGLNELLADLKKSPEDRELVDNATAYLRGRKAFIVRKNRQAAEKRQQGKAGTAPNGLVQAPVRSNGTAGGEGQAPIVASMI